MFKISDTNETEKVLLLSNSTYEHLSKTSDAIEIMLQQMVLKLDAFYYRLVNL